MRILTFGLFAFLSWSAFSTYIYVCKINGFCNEPVTMQYVAPVREEVVAVDTPAVLQAVINVAIPEKEMIYFAFDKSDIKTAGISDNYIQESNAFLEQNADAKLSIIGFTDAIGTNIYNNALGYRRAESAQYYFESKGIPKDKIIIDSQGENLPVGDNGTIEGREKNRRTEITIKN